MTVLFILGEPGVGKTTLARKIIEADSYLVPSPKWTVGSRVCAAGHYTGAAFDGADTVPYNGVDAAISFWERELYVKELTLLDGDRFSYRKALDRFASVAPCRAILIEGEDTASGWRKLRGSKQNDAWIKGRRTKSARFAEEFVMLFRMRAGADAQEAINWIGK